MLGGVSSPAVIGFADASEIPQLAGDVAGVGGSQAAQTGAGDLYYVTGAVALDTDNATLRVGGFAAEDIVPERVAMEGRTPVREVLDACGGLRGHRFGDVLVDDAGAGLFGIDCVGMGRVTFAHRRGDAALGPGR